ncbi:hypothetical protein BBM55_04525 [Vibrio parahaemolyticus]|nr:hypothetical protein [Vibrio parahaemolyticus]OEA22853.1 hypothetical protein BBM55_04525 [Vibrio parahaemolyticus]
MAGLTQNTLLELSQKCEQLSGKATLIDNIDWLPESSREGLYSDRIRTFDVSGFVSERFITLNLRHTDRTRLGVISHLLVVDGDGTVLSGESCWYAPNASKVISGSEVFYRNKNRATSEFEKLKKEFEKTIKDGNSEVGPNTDIVELIPQQNVELQQKS